ncbi:MAG TPA: DUF4988 domain-containing protein, partial [Candidatus Coprenecus pullistercoris]|nr:DUF4988 domain-containing protein [Candidatus Coprenecus pullistercoris]
MKQLINNPLPRLMAVIAATLVLVASLGSCSKYDDTDLKDSIAALDERLAALEAIRDGIQSDINDLQALVEKLEGGVTVDAVTATADGYTISFSDGTSITITDGKDGEKGDQGPDGEKGPDGAPGEDAPIVIVIEENGIYYWGYRNADGTEEPILVDGEKVPASGITPQVDINEDGEWIISVDNGVNWQETGVSAGATPVFKNVEETETTVVITLNDGNDTQLVFAKSSGLSFKFLGADGEPVEEAYFDYAEAKVFDYTMTKPEDAQLTITKPEGWDIELTESTVTVTAPSEDVMAYAESAGLVSMLLTTSEGTNAITSLRVVIGDEPAQEPTEATIAEFLAATVGDGVYYQLTGVITNIANTTFGNLTIKDETGEVNVYGLTAEGPLESNDKSFGNLGLVVYDTLTLVTVRGEHNGEAQGGGTSTPAYYVSHKDYEAPVGNPAALIISEYVEGSSNNKYLE